MEKAQYSTDAANIRAGIAEASVKVLDPSYAGTTTTFKAKTNGSKFGTSGYPELPANWGGTGTFSMTEGTEYGITVNSTTGKWTLTTP